MRPAALAAWLIVMVSAPAPSHAETALVAVAANFAAVAAEIERQFEQSGEHTIDLVIGSTGKLYAQIVNGAPFHVLLSADQERPRRLVDAGLAVRGSQRTYAIGELVLWSPDPDRLQGEGAAVLRAGDFRSLAIANPRLAPYGTAAVQALEALDVYQDVRDRIVMGENVGQAHDNTDRKKNHHRDSEPTLAEDISRAQSEKEVAHGDDNV